MDIENELEFANENTPLIDTQPTSSGYLALSSTSALTVPSQNATLQLSTQVSEQLDEAAAAIGTTTTSTSNSNNTSSSHRPLSGNNKEFKQEINRRLQRDYPWLYVLVSSLVVLLLASLNIYIERLQTDRFEFDDFDVLSYRTLSGLALLGAALNIFFALLAILTIKLRRYFLIQLVALIHLVASCMSFVYMIIFNIVVLVFSILGSNDSTPCDYLVCITGRSITILFGVLITILEILFFIIIQLNFMRNVNMNFSI